MSFRSLIILLLLNTGIISHAQDTKELHENAKAFMRKGDHANATMILNRCYQQTPEDISIIKDLALSYFYQKDYSKAIEVLKPNLDKELSDDQCYQIAGMIYRAMDQPEACVTLFKKGLDKFPESGAMYYEMGEILWAQKNYDAIKQWEKGIQKDPSYPGNYYSASRYYYLTKDRVWSLIYGEIFVNMEPQSSRTVEIKEILLNGYKKLFADANLSNAKEKNAFAKNFLEIMNKQTDLGNYGIHTGSLIMIRTRFLLDWNNEYADKFPMKLFLYHHQLLQDGLFEAYNQWLFGAAENLAAFQKWTQTYNAQYSQFIEFQKNRIFRMPLGQYYQ